MRHRPALRAEDGQVIVFVVAILTVLIGMGALVIDGGSWFRAQRHLQTSADAAALAGAQDLPYRDNCAVHCDHVRADELHGAAGTYRHFPSTAPSCAPNTCIDVAAVTTAPGYLAKIYGAVFNNVNDHRARSGRHLRSLDAEERRADRRQERGRMRGHDSGLLRPEGDLQLRREQRSLEHDRADRPDLPLDAVDSLASSTPASAEPAQGVGSRTDTPTRYPPASGTASRRARPSGRSSRGSRDGIGTPLFFPVFDTTANSGSSWFFHIIGWAAFVIDKRRLVGAGAASRLTGSLRDVHRVGSCRRETRSVATTDFGVHVISLIQ